MKFLQQAIELYQAGMVGKKYPPCFGNSVAWKEWTTLENEAKTEPRKFACRDCTKQFQVKSIRNNVCLIPDVSVEYVIRQRD